MKTSDLMEQWKEIDGFNGIYQVSNKGRIRSIDHVEHCGGCIKNRNRKGRILSITVEKNGRARVWLGKDGEGKKYLVNRIVYAAFCGELVSGLDVMHLDDTPLNNCDYNLRQGTTQVSRIVNRESWAHI